MRLELTLYEQLRRYCEYSESAQDWVLSGALELVFRRDKQFQKWLAQQDQQAEAPTRIGSERERP